MVDGDARSGEGSVTQRSPIVRHVERQDAAAWLAMRVALWPDGSAAEHAGEIERFLAGEAPEPAAVLLAVDEADAPLGFAELSLRACAEGCRSSPVAYLEGWYVVPEARHRGIGRALVAAAETWGRSRGCSEFASDTEPDNHVSAAAHRALGFSEAGWIRCFRKDL